MSFWYEGWTSVTLSEFILHWPESLLNCCIVISELTWPNAIFWSKNIWSPFSFAIQTTTYAPSLNHRPLKEPTTILLLVDIFFYHCGLICSSCIMITSQLTHRQLKAPDTDLDFRLPFCGSSLLHNGNKLLSSLVFFGVLGIHSSETRAFQLAVFLEP